MTEIALTNTIKFKDVDGHREVETAIPVSKIDLGICGIPPAYLEILKICLFG